MNPVVHFEIPAKDRKRMADFYTQVFGWRTQMLGPEMGNYVVVTTTELDNNGRPKNPGSINGGFFQKSNDKPDQYPSIVIAVNDIKQHMEKVKEAGGELVGEPIDIPGTTVRPGRPPASDRRGTRGKGAPGEIRNRRDAWTGTKRKTCSTAKDI